MHRFHSEGVAPQQRSECAYLHWSLISREFIRRINTTTCVWVLLPNKGKSLAPQLGKPKQVVVRPIDSSVQQGRCDGGPFYTGGNALDHRHRLEGLPEGVRSMLIACNISAHHLISKRGTGAIHCRIVTLCTTCVANAVEGVLETST